MKRITVKSKSPCFIWHEWRYLFSRKAITYYHCPFCLSRKAVISKSIHGYNPVDHDWLNCAKKLKPNEELLNVEVKDE